MRLITEKMDEADLMKYAVMLDGVELPYVFEVDDAEGYARCTVAEWPSDVPTRELDVEDLATGEPLRVRFATVPNWQEVNARMREAGNGFRDVIVRGNIQIRRLA
jgi:hypothetical protein